MSLDLAVKVVADIDEAMEHIRTYSTHHTESIITNDLGNAERFLNEVDSAAVMVNASTRFTDGGEFGFGAEVGISTQKLHARGPDGAARTHQHEVAGARVGPDPRLTHYRSAADSLQPVEPLESMHGPARPTKPPRENECL